MWSLKLSLWRRLALLKCRVEPVGVPLEASAKRKRTRKGAADLQKINVLSGHSKPSDSDRFRVYREAVLNCVEAALAGVAHEVFVTAPTQAQGLPGIVEAQNEILLRGLQGSFSHVWIVQADVEVPWMLLRCFLGWALMSRKVWCLGMMTAKL